MPTPCPPADDDPRRGPGPAALAYADSPTTSRATSAVTPPTPKTSCRRPRARPARRASSRRAPISRLALPHPAQHVAQPGSPSSRQPHRRWPDTVTPEVEPEPTWFCDDIELDRLRKLGGRRDRGGGDGALRRRARTVILLDLEGLTETDVAAVLGCPVGTVKSRLARARQALRRLLRDYAP